MQSRIKIWHFIAGLCTVIIVLRAGILLDIFSLMISYISFLFSSPKEALNHLNFELIDYLLSMMIIITVFVFVIVKYKSSFLQNAVSFNSSVLIVLAAVFLCAPLITNNNPDFQKDLGVTKLLPPFSTVKVIHMKDNSSNYKNEFFKLRQGVIRSTFDESLIFADSADINNNGITYYQKGKAEEIDKENLNKGNTSVIESRLYVLGTDEFGRDIFTRLIYGTRVSLFVGLGAVAITLFLGVSLGFIAGYRGGITDTIISRFSDMLLSFPIIFLIILILALFGNSLFTVILVLGYSGWMGLFKIVRGEVISIKNKEYFISAKMAGLSGKNLLLKEIFPVIIAPVIVNTVFQYGNVILAESGLSYLGIGIGNIYPSWGGMIESGQEYLTEAWWMILFPGLALFITLFTANNLGKEINLYFNPRLKHD